MIDFNDVIPTARRVVETTIKGAGPTSATLIRDLKGRIALFLEFKEEPEAALESSLKAALDTALECFWRGKLWLEWPKASEITKTFGVTVRRERQKFGTSSGATPFDWHLIDRTYSKRGWLDSRPLPWPNIPGKTPAIVSFYSYKGGVGRSTALAAVSMILSSAGKKVVVVDLDLEAPGVFTLLGPKSDIDVGVVDYLIHKALDDSSFRIDLCAKVITDKVIIGESGQALVAIPAGRIDDGYIDKIARIDMNSYADDATDRLRAMLSEIRTVYAPDFILLDVRAGMHDIGGLSLNALSHMNILFCLDTPQAWNGLYPILGRLARIKKDREILLVHAMATPSRLDSGAHERFRSNSYSAFQQHYFEEGEEMPDIGDESAPYGVHIPIQDALMNITTFEGSDLRKSIMDSGSPFRLLVEKIGERLERPTI
jgi:cellulose biosynthesis protein BcsQ